MPMFLVSEPRSSNRLKAALRTVRILEDQHLDQVHQLMFKNPLKSIHPALAGDAGHHDRSLNIVKRLKKERGGDSDLIGPQMRAAAPDQTCCFSSRRGHSSRDPEGERSPAKLLSTGPRKEQVIIEIKKLFEIPGMNLCKVDGVQHARPIQYRPLNFFLLLLNPCGRRRSLPELMQKQRFILE